MIKTMINLIELAVAIVSLVLILNIYLSFTKMMARIDSEYSDLFGYFDEMTDKFTNPTTYPTENPENQNPDTQNPKNPFSDFDQIFKDFDFGQKA